MRARVKSKATFQYSGADNTGRVLVLDKGEMFRKPMSPARKRIEALFNN